MPFKQLGIKEYILIILILVVFVTAITISFKVSNNINGNKKGNGDNKEDNTHTRDNIIHIVNSDIKIKDRVVLKQENTILIGNNIQELENGFFDVNMDFSQPSKNEIIIYINKLWYKGFEVDYVDETYLGNLIDYTSQAFNIKSLKQYEDKVCRYIKEEYHKLRSGKSDFTILKTDNLSFTSNNEEGMLKITLKVEVEKEIK